MDDMEMEEESVEYDLDEEVVEEDDEEVVEEATKLSDNVAEPKGGEGEGESPFTKAPKHSKVEGAGAPVKAKDGSEGNHGDVNPSDSGASSNLKVEPKKA